MQKSLNKPRVKNTNFHFYTKRQYYDDLVSRINKLGSGDRVDLMTMAFNPEVAGVNQIVDELCAASKRGVDVNFFVDAYAFLAQDNSLPGPLFFGHMLSNNLRKPFNLKKQLITKLKKSGAKSGLINLPKKRYSNPYAGRCHIKLTLIDNYIYFGGCNLNDNRQIDFMVGINNKTTAGFLRDFISNAAEDGNVRRFMNSADLEYKIDKSSTIFVDSGKPRQSVIFNEALKLIDEAKESIFITCQFFPNGKIAKYLKRAYERGVKVTIVYNLPKKHGFIKALGLYPVYFFEKLRLPSEMFSSKLTGKKPFLHAKVLASEKSLMFGSHNFIPSGVKYGTSEIALLTTDKKLKSAILDGIAEQLRLL